MQTQIDSSAMQIAFVADKDDAISKFRRERDAGDRSHERGEATSLNWAEDQTVMLEVNNVFSYIRGNLKKNYAEVIIAL